MGRSMGGDEFAGGMREWVSGMKVIWCGGDTEGIRRGYGGDTEGIRRGTGGRRTTHEGGLSRPSRGQGSSSRVLTVTVLDNL